MPDFRLTTPVAFLIFNRPETTLRVFGEIARMKPPKLLVVGDGPRPDRIGEASRVAAARDVIAKVDWECEILTNFAETNLGCKNRVSSGIDWIFEQVDSAIILEDDCLPDSTFFRYCEELLGRYRNDKRIGAITGTNFQPDFESRKNSYYFSKYSMIWGWASWRDRWQTDYDVKMSDWPRVRDTGLLSKLLESWSESSYWRKIFERVYRGEIDTWDYQWFFANFLYRRLCITPSVNLISNIGYGDDATHTTSNESKSANRPLQPMQFPMVHPDIVRRDVRADYFTDRYFFRGTYIQRTRQRIRAALNRLKSG